jgi:stage III sporulation protein AB
MIKLAGVILIIFAGANFGFRRAAREQTKLEQGIALKRMLYLLQGEIRYGFTPLPEAIRTIAQKTAEDIRPFLLQAAQQLETHSQTSFSNVWETAILEQLKPKMIETAFLEPVVTMGETIGYLDKEMQEKTIGFAIEQMEEEIFKRKDQVIRNCKMYRSLGLSFGALIVIVLV